MAVPADTIVATASPRKGRRHRAHLDQAPRIAAIVPWPAAPPRHAAAVLDADGCALDEGRRCISGAAFLHR
jgi:hypothetical protein